jgi:hypothetical protein
LADVNRALAAVGSRVWPLDLVKARADVRRLLAKAALEDAEVTRVMEHFLLPRERLLEIIGNAGREPNVPGGGALDTHVTSHGYSYPQLWIVQGDVDYSRFDRFHVNTADDGTGVDEVAQLLSGAGVAIHHQLADGSVLTLRVDSSADAGWLVTYNGGRPHIGSLSGASAGTKMLVQAIGPPRWAVRYTDGA